MERGKSGNDYYKSKMSNINNGLEQKFQVITHVRRPEGDDFISLLTWVIYLLKIHYVTYIISYDNKINNFIA